MMFLMNQPIPDYDYPFNVRTPYASRESKDQIRMGRFIRVKNYKSVKRQMDAISVSIEKIRDWVMGLEEMYEHLKLEDVDLVVRPRCLPLEMHFVVGVRVIMSVRNVDEIVIDLCKVGE